MKCRYLVTESCFHVAYLVDKMSKLAGSVKVIVRDKNNLDRAALKKVHDELALLKELSDSQIEAIENAYKAKLSLSERALIKLHGVPASHVLSLPDTRTVTNLNSPELLNELELESYKQDLSAGIFLDCILKPRWLEIFDHRIVNAHSAVLPHARGMHAIEQITAIGDAARLLTCAGATIHYIDEKVDMGSLIRTQQLAQLWDCEDIWEVKAQSYMTAFALLNAYLSEPNSFTRKDGHPYEQEIGPEFKLKDFTPEVAERAVRSYKEMQARCLQEEAKSIISNKL